MMNKKIAAFLAVGALMTAIGTTAFAADLVVSVPVCPYSNCTMDGCHQHDGTSYGAHFIGDGHTYHADCGVSGCTVTGNHTHHASGHGRHHSGGHHR